VSVLVDAFVVFGLFVFHLFTTSIIIERFHKLNRVVIRLYCLF